MQAERQPLCPQRLPNPCRPSPHQSSFDSRWLASSLSTPTLPLYRSGTSTLGHAHARTRDRPTGCRRGAVRRRGMRLHATSHWHGLACARRRTWPHPNARLLLQCMRPRVGSPPPCTPAHAPTGSPLKQCAARGRRWSAPLPTTPAPGRGGEDPANVGTVVVQQQRSSHARPAVLPPQCRASNSAARQRGSLPGPACSMNRATTPKQWF